MHWYFLIFACLGVASTETCTAPKSEPVWESREECAKAARVFVALHLPTHRIGMNECHRELVE